MAGVADPTGSGILDPNNLLSYAFNTVNGAPMSVEEIKRRRAVAQALAGQKRGYPKTIGEGLTSLGEALGDRRVDVQLSAAEQDLARRVGTDIQKAAGPAGFGGPAAPVPHTPAVPAVPGVPGPRTDAEDPVNAARNSMTASLIPGGPGGAASNPTLAAGASSPQEPTPSTGGPEPDDTWAARERAIGGIESGGRRDPYTVLGAVTPKGDRAYGKYQVMGRNVPEWTQAALGRRMTPQEFLADPAAQNAVFRNRFGSYVDKYGEEGAARAWYGGERGMKNLNATDQHGRLTVGGYGQDYLRRLQGANTATSGAPAGDDTGPPNLATDDSGNPPTPTTIKPMRVAQAGGPGTSPLVPPTVTPAEPYRAIDPAARQPLIRPTPPVFDTRPTPEEISGFALKNKYPGHEQAAAAADLLIARGEAKRKTAYENQKNTYDKDLAAWEAEVKAEREREYNRPKTQLEQRKAEFELAEKEKEARLQDRLGGRKVEDFVKDFKTEHADASRMVGALNNVREAESAIKAGAITGYGANARLDWERMKAWALSNNKSDDIAAQTQLLKNNLDSTIALALTKIQPGDTRVTEGDLKMASGLTGSIEQQRSALLKILAVAKEAAHDKIDAFEERRHQKVGGTPLEGDFVLNVKPTAQPKTIQRLIADKDDPAAIKEFDEAFGPGSARLEIARARRAEEAARRK